MIICKTPYRISFFGGGTDYPEWYLKNGGEVISSTINKYLYVSIRELPPFFKHKFRVSYSRIEMVKSINQIKHGVVREGLKMIKKKLLNNGYEIHYDGDLPARSGVGSSSSFVVGFIHGLYAFHNLKISKKELAEKSILLEQKILKETVGSQDQIAASYGGFNSIKFNKNGKFLVNSLIKDEKKLKNISYNFYLIFTNINRTAKFIAKTYVNNLDSKKKDLKEILDHVKIAKKMIIEDNINSIGKLLDETWNIKRSLSNSVSNQLIDSIYAKGIRSGADGGKLLGAGGGGFLLFYVKNDNQEKFKKKMKDYLIIDFQLTNDKSEIIFNK
jgi:D-glycero-alpha-D-manno-heptose-7-phosphate kinase